jgi:dTDP-glucose pyrophosphorylase
MENLIYNLDISIKDAFQIISKTGEKCLIIIEENGKLLGTLSDGDLRKAILKGDHISNSIEKIFNPKPVTLCKGDYSIDDAKEIFLKNRFDLIPIVDRKGKVVDVLLWNKVFNNGEQKKYEKLDVPVVIMTGGKGTRLEPFTKVLPKSLVPIHDKPIIEHIIERFTASGCLDFYLTVNYKSRILKAYFEELNPDYDINFVGEQEPLGTAGSLRLLDGKFTNPFFVTNCDIIIKADYAILYKFHLKGCYDITLVASAKEYIIPYGTCELNGDGHLSHINEKPHYEFLINTGLYILNPDVLKLIPENKFFHITHLIEDAKNQGKKVGVFPIDDDAWIDVGQWAEYKKAIELL